LDYFTSLAFKTLKKCQGCHNQQTENFEVQDLNWFQMISNKQDPKRADWVSRVKIETDKKKMEFLGNIFTHYNYTTTDIIQRNQNNKLEIKSTKDEYKAKSIKEKRDKRETLNSKPL